MALREAHRVLVPGGVVHVSVKLGNGSEWEVARYGEPRWFQHWSAPALDAVLEDAGFRICASFVERGSEATWRVRLARAV